MSRIDKAKTFAGFVRGAARAEFEPSGPKEMRDKIK